MVVQNSVVHHTIDCTAVAVEEHIGCVAAELHNLVAEVERRIVHTVQAEGERHIALGAGIDHEEGGHHIDLGAGMDQAGELNSKTLVGEHYSLVEGPHRELAGTQRVEEHRTARLEAVDPTDSVAAGVVLPILPAENNPVPGIDFASVSALSR